MTSPSDDGADADGTYPDAWHLTRAASRFARTAGRLPGSPYSTVAWRLLTDLESAGSARIGDLAAAHRVSQPSMTGLVRRLESEGWVSREADPEDGRATRVSATVAGLGALLDYRTAIAARVQPVLEALTKSDRAALARAAQVLLELSEHPALTGR